MSTPNSLSGWARWNSTFKRLLGPSAALCVVILFFSLVVETPDGGKVGDFAWRPLLCILGANLAFGALLGGLPSIGLPSMGLVVATVALTVIAAMADETAFQIRRVLVLSTVLAAGSYGIFIALLGLTMPVWPAFLLA